MNAATMPMPMPGTEMKRCRYQDPDSTQTLREALREYYAANPDLVNPEEIQDEAAAWFTKHDATHVIFGNSTSLTDEALNDIWSLIGTEVTWKQYADFLKLQEGKSVLKEIGVWGVIKATLLAVPHFFTVFSRVRKMKKKWPWEGVEALIDRPIDELRAEYGIEILSIPDVR